MTNATKTTHRKRQRHEDIYSDLMRIKREYDELVAFASKVQNLCDVHTAGAHKVDWAAVGKEAANLDALRDVP